MMGAPVIHDSLTGLDGTTALLITRVESIFETTTSLRDTVIVKLDLLQSSMDQLHSDSERSAKDAEKLQRETRKALSDEITNVRREAKAAAARTRSSLSINLVMTSFAALIALILLLVG